MKSLKKNISTRLVIYTCTVLTGVTGLVFQIVWQKYLSFLVGSEARSVSLVVAFFLLGLAAGYRYWGRLTESQYTRARLLKFYGFIEMGIGAYAIIFPQYFELVRKIGYASPDHLIVDSLLTFALIFIPTFLMGATIPILTKVMPESLSEVNECHAKIYGLNTFGAFIGCIFGGFFLVPKLGLPFSLLACGLVNIIVGAIFGLNQLKGMTQSAQDFDNVPNKFGSLAIYCFVFIIGAVSISLEVLFIRVMGLTIGSGHFIYPLVVGIFVLGLAIGSLSLHKKTLDALFSDLYKLIIYLAIVYLSIPYWPYWLNNVRVSLVSIPTNYPIYLFICFLFLAVFLIPFLYHSGRLLPFGYALIDKNKNDYGKVCGRVYFYNTTGTVVGAVILSYLFLYYLDFDQIFKINLILLSGLLAFLLWKQKRSLVWIGLIAIVVIALPRWDRASHYIGLFRNRTPLPDNFSGVFKKPKGPGEVLYFKDDPNTTVSVMKHKATLTQDTVSIVTNGKSDGSTYSQDYSTMFLAGSLGYLFGPDSKDLTASVIGLGTGITAGALGIANEVKKVDVLEISKGVIESNIHFQDANFNILKNPKVKLIETDAFKYFSRQSKPVDIVVAEPSNPWVVGVENLFTIQFYDMVKNVLTPNGVFAQWVQLYEINADIFYSLISNVTTTFPHFRLFMVSAGDALILASKAPFQVSDTFRHRFNEKRMRSAHENLGIESPTALEILSAYGSEELKWFSIKNELGIHDLEFPKIGYLAGKEMFMGRTISLDRLIEKDFERWVRFKSHKHKAFMELVSLYPNGVPHCKKPDRLPSIFCDHFQKLFVAYKAVTKENCAFLPREKLNAYRSLRNLGFYPYDSSFLESIKKSLKSGEDADQFVREYTLERQWDQAASAAKYFREQRIYTEEDLKGVLDAIKQGQKRIEAFLAVYARTQEEKI
jgi:spermidine synthase